MREPGPPLDPSSPEDAIQRDRAQAAFVGLAEAIERAVEQHNSGGGVRLEMQSRGDRLDVYQQGLIFPSLQLALDPTGLEMTYYLPARSPNGSPVRGSIVPAHEEHLLVIDESGVAHRIGCSDLARFLLRPAFTVPKGK